jgi:transposase
MIVSIGIDVSKEKLDIFKKNQNRCIPNEKTALEKAFGDEDRSCRIVMEATGKYHRLAFETLHKMGFQVMIINPFQSRHFAKAMNVICKTDRVDAKILSLFGEKMDFKETIPPTFQQLSLQELTRYLDDLKKMRKGLMCRLHESQGEIEVSARKIFQQIDEEIQEIEKRCAEEIDKDEELAQKSRLLQSIPGVGAPTAMMLISTLRELGQVTSRQISALAGLAPMNSDSGLSKGKRHIRGGRHEVRSHLYMPILGAATRHNARLASIYQRLIASGKAKKVALTACMRKLLIWANAILASKRPWGEMNCV